MKTSTIHQLGLCVCLWTFCMNIDTVKAQDCLLKDNGCLYSVEGNCVPRRTTYGYYETHWRTWPYAQPPKMPRTKKRPSHPPKGSSALPDAEVPRLRDEASLNPKLPSTPDELVPEGSVPQQQFEIDRSTDPFRDDAGASESPFDRGPNTPAVERSLEDDLNIPPAGSSGVMRLDRSRYSQSPGPESAPSAADNGFGNPLRRGGARPQTVPVQYTRPMPVARPVSYDAPLNEPALYDVENDFMPQNLRTPFPNELPSVRSAGPNPLRRR